MEEEFELAIRSQLLTLKNQMEIIREYIDKYDQRSMKLKQTITNELIVALISRFEKNEEMIRDLDQKLDEVAIKVQNNLDRSLKELRDEISEAELSKAISKIFEEKEIKVSSKALKDLKYI